MANAISQIVDCALKNWTPGIGDPNTSGWIIAAAYTVAAVFSLRLVVRRTPRALERAFWGSSGLGLLFLAVNKQLDLQSFLTASGRCAARLQGWYDMRRAVQADFIISLAAAAILGGLVALWSLRGTLHRTGIALLGLIWITGYVLMRAVGFHHVDRLIGIQVVGFRLNWAFELGGITVFILGCIIASRAGRYAVVK